MIIKDLLKNYYKFFLNPNPTKFIDLGLSVLWADRNIDADSETDYGNYFNWGGTEPILENNNKDLSTPPLANDIVNIKLGGLCRIPTMEELEELMDLPSKWVENYKNSGHNGRIFTGNGNSIFIPAAGYWYYNYYLNDNDSYCGLWSSSLDSSTPDYAWNLYFFSDDVGMCSNYYYYGFPVRGVYPK